MGSALCSAWLEKSGLALLLEQTALACSFGRRGEGGTSLTTSKPHFFFSFLKSLRSKYGQKQDQIHCLHNVSF